jgi:hypothetical protein
MRLHPFRDIQEILEASRRGDSLYALYKRLESSSFLLKTEQKTAFQLLFQTSISNLSEEHAQEFSEFPTSYLEIYTPSLSTPAAQKLSQFQGKSISFPELKQLDKNSSKKLALFRGDYLFLKGLEKLDANTALQLSKFKGRVLSLKGLKEMDDPVAKGLSRFQGQTLYLDGLPEINESSLKALMKIYGSCKETSISLDGVKQIHLPLAQILAEFQGTGLFLNTGEESRQDILTKAMVQLQGRWISLGGVCEIDEASAEALARYEGTFYTTEKILEQIYRYR